VNHRLQGGREPGSDFAGLAAGEVLVGIRAQALAADRRAASGTIAALELGDPAGSYLSDLGPRLLRRFREADLLLRPLGNTVYVMPPYCIEDKDLARIWAEIGAAADDLATQ